MKLHTTQVRIFFYMCVCRMTGQPRRGGLGRELHLAKLCHGLTTSHHLTCFMIITSSPLHTDIHTLKPPHSHTGLPQHFIVETQPFSPQQPASSNNTQQAPPTRLLLHTQPPAAAPKKEQEEREREVGLAFHPHTHTHPTLLL